MKKIILTATVIFFTFLQTKAQQENPALASANYSLPGAALIKPGKASMNVSTNVLYDDPIKDYEYYIEKKKKTQTYGLVTLGFGLAASGVGLLISSNSKSYNSDATAAILFIAGAASGIASIPFMAISMGYNHKAKLAFKQQPIGFGLPVKKGKTITGIGISIPLGK